MAIGRISGSMLKSNLTRNGVDLAFETNILYLDVTNARVGIGTSTPSTALHVIGTTTTDNLVVNNITSDDSTAIQINDAVNVSGTLTANSGLVANGITYPTTDGTANQVLVTNGSGVLSFTSLNSFEGITFVGDDSTGSTINTAETLKFAGGNNITTTVIDDTVTITGSKDININSITSDDSTAIQVNDGLNVAGTLNADTITTNTISSGDSSAVSFGSSVSVTGDVTTSGFYYGDGRYLTGLAPALQNYQFSGTASDISTYYVAKNLANYTAGALTSATVSVSTTPTLLGSFATDIGFPNITVIPSGKVQVLFETQKALGPNSYYCYAEIYKRNTSGTETLLFTTDNSSPLVANTLVQQDVSYFVGTPVTLGLTDRIVIKIYAVMTLSTANITLNWDDNTSAGLLLPTLPASATNFVPYVNATADVNLGSYGLKASSVTTNNISSDDSSAVQINDAVNVSGTLTSPAIVTNNISSGDSTAIQVNDDLNVSGAITSGSNVIASVNLISSNSSGDEGGEILLAKPQTNTTLIGTGVTIDAYQNRLRFFEQGGTARGYFVDITQGGSAASSELATKSYVDDQIIAAGSGTVTSITAGTGLTASPSNPITTSGTISLDFNTIVARVVGDDSTGTDLRVGETVKIAGGNNIFTAVSGDVVTITGSKDIDVNSISSGDSSAIQINDAVNVSGTLNAKTIVTNDLISEDSTAINVLDGLNISGTMDMNNNIISNVQNPIADQDAATKNYVDSELSNITTTFYVEDGTSTIATIDSGDTLRIIGSGGITTAVSGDTLTITGANQAQGITFFDDASTSTAIPDGGALQITSGEGISTSILGNVITITNTSTQLEIDGGSAYSVYNAISEALIDGGTA